MTTYYYYSITIIPCREAAEKFPEVKFEERYLDTVCLNMVQVRHTVLGTGRVPNLTTLIVKMIYRYDIGIVHFLIH